MAIDLSKYKLSTTSQQNADLSKYKLPEKTEESKQSISQKIWNGIVGAGIGAAKGVGSTLYGVGKLTEKAVSPIQKGLDIATSAIIGQEVKTEPVFGEKPEILKPEGTAQKIGYTAEQLAEFFIPVGGGVKAVGALTKIAPKASGLAKLTAKSVGEGAEMALKTTAQTGGDIPSTSRAFILGLLVNPALKAVDDIVTKFVPERLMSTIFKTTDDDLRAAYSAVAKGQELNPTLAKEALDKGLRGSSKNMAVYSFKKLDDLERQVQNVSKSIKEPIVVGNKNSYVNFLKTVSDTFKGGFYSSRARTANTLIKELGQTESRRVSVPVALKLRRFIDGMRNTLSFRLDPKLAPKQEEFKEAADLLRIKLSDAGLGNLMNEERIFIQAIDSIVEGAAKTQNKNVIGLVDLLAGGGGMVSGNITGGIGAAAAIRGFQQPFTLTNLAHYLNKIEGFSEPASKIIVGTQSKNK